MLADASRAAMLWRGLLHDLIALNLFPAYRRQQIVCRHASQSSM